MSKRSGLTLIGDLKRGFIDIGRYRYILRKTDMEPWRDQFCPICGAGFSSPPSFYMNNYSIHWDCWESPHYEVWVSDLYDKLYEGYK